MADLKFSYEEADRLKTRLVSDVNKVDGELNRMVSTVEGCRRWWSGGSEEAFINNFKETKANIVKSLNTCMEDYQKLITQISEAKRESDANLARQINK